MRLVIDNTTRFFTVVGAPYLPERHADTDVDGLVPPRTAQGVYARKRRAWWLSNDR